jgi:hypothetical protein
MAVSNTFHHVHGAVFATTDQSYYFHDVGAFLVNNSKRREEKTIFYKLNVFQFLQNKQQTAYINYRGYIYMYTYFIYIQQSSRGLWKLIIYA